MNLVPLCYLRDNVSGDVLWCMHLGFETQCLKGPSNVWICSPPSESSPSILLMKGFGWHLHGLLSLGRQQTPFEKYSGKGTVLSQCPLRDVYTTLYTLGPAPSSPGVCDTAPLQKKSHTSKTSEFELQRPLQKGTETFSTSCFPVHGPERFSSCANSVPHYQHLSLLFSPERVPSSL